jgi:hypothetical protein
MATPTEEPGSPQDGATAPPQDGAPAPAAPRPVPPVRTGLLLGAVLVLGLLLGAVAASVLGDGPVVVEVPVSPEDQAAAGPSVRDEDASARFIVTGACLGAVNAAQDTLLLVDDVGQASAELDAARLDEIVRRLMPLEDRLQTGLEACRVSAAVDPPADPPGTSGTPTTAPTTTSDAGD